MEFLQFGAYTVITAIGGILLFVGIFGKFGSLVSVTKKEVGKKLWLCLGGIIVMIIGVLLNIWASKGYPLPPWNSDGTSTPTITSPPTSTLTPSMTPTFAPTLTPTPQYLPAAIAMKQYYEDIIVADEFDLEKLYEFQKNCSDDTVEDYKKFWLEFTPQYKIYGCSAKNTLDVNVSYFYREYNFSKQTSDEGGKWIRYILGSGKNGWEIIKCNIIQSQRTYCDFFDSNEE